MTVDTYLHRGRQLLIRWAGDRRVRGPLRWAGCFGAGFFLSAPGIARRAMPFSMALVSTMTGKRSLVTGLGSILGYLLFWGEAGAQGAIWSLLAMVTALSLGRSRLAGETPLLIPALSALWTAATGLAFQLAGRDTPTGIYLLRVALAWPVSQLCAALIPKQEAPRRRGAQGETQLRLELSGRMLGQIRSLLMETEDAPIDEEALLVRTRERACGGCPNRRACRMPGAIPRELLRRPMTENTSLPFACRKPGRMVLEIRRTQEQYRLLRADRTRRREYRAAVSQQYLFLSEYLLEQAARLPRQGRRGPIRFTPEVGTAARSREVTNGDRFRHFSGPGGTYFLLLCDGMGTGFGAAEEGNTALTLLEGMLTAGFPPEYALESLNSLLVLRGRAGAVTVDLAEVHLDTGAAVLRKWGAAPSLLIRSGKAEKIGTAGPPPGIRGADAGQSVERLSLSRGEILVLRSDGVDGEEVRRRALTGKAGPAGAMAARLLEAGAAGASDDATVAVLRLHRPGMLT